uniref:ANK_REP_REGION domain-containing protein n=1 Tax=Anopheles albimanus TaxID=7167 RepID=A0A182F1X4_ANOAL
MARATNRFHAAATVGSVAILKEATRWEANSVDEQLRTPVLLAAANGRTAALELLLKRGGDIRRTDRQGNTALHLAAIGGHRTCIECLLGAGCCNLFEMNTAGRTALDEAKLHRQQETAELLERATKELCSSRTPEKLQELRSRAAKNYEKLKHRYGAVISLHLGDSFRALEEHSTLEETA